MNISSDQESLEIKGQRLWNLLEERTASITNATPNQKFSEIKLTFYLLKDYFLANLLNDLRFYLFLGLIILSFFIIGFLYDLLTFGKIDRALKVHQAAKAESLIFKKLEILPNHTGLKSRLIESYYQMGRLKDVYKLSAELQEKHAKNRRLLRTISLLTIDNTDPKNRPIVVEILDKASDKCLSCKRNLIEIAAEYGREQVVRGRYREAYYHLNKAYTTEHELNLSGAHGVGKRELAKVINLEAREILDQAKKAKDKTVIQETQEKVTKLYLESAKLLPDGNIYLRIGRLYRMQPESLDTLYNALDAFRIAYEYNVLEAKGEYNKTRDYFFQKIDSLIPSKNQQLEVKQKYPAL